MPTLQLCLIARDEAALLPGCLDSVRGIVDHVVVVDTGSTDDTVAIAQAAGATVLTHDWADDFAAARNAGLRAMQSGWMLVLDADERLAPGAGDAIRAAIRADDFDDGLLPLHNASRMDAPTASIVAGSNRLGEPILLTRLFRLAPGMAWHGALHERLMHPEGPSRRRRTLDAPIVHLGYTSDQLTERDKHARNLRILRHMTESAGDDPVPWCYLARDAMRAGEVEEARAAAAQAWTRLMQTQGGELPPGGITLVSVRADLQLAVGDVAGATQTLGAARAWGATHPNLDLLQATVGLAAAANARGGTRRRLLRGAEAASRRAIDAHNRPQTDEISAGATSWMPELRLGESLLLQGKLPAAVQAFQRCLSALPMPLEGLPAQAATAARVGAAEAVLPNDPGQSLQLLEPVLATPWPDAWVVAAAACAALQKHDDAALFASQGAKRLQAGWLSSHRKKLLTQSRR